MDSTFEIGSNYGKLIGENNKLQRLVTDLNLELNPCQVKSHLQLKFSTSRELENKKFEYRYLRLLLLAHNQLESLPFLKRLSVKTFYRQE